MKASRRGFFGLMGGAAAAGPSLAKMATDNAVLRQAGFASGLEVVGAAPMAMPSTTSSVVAKFVQWVKRTGIPAWKMAEIKRVADYRRSEGLDPDLACLLSVSAGHKARTQRKRNLERAIDASLSSVGRQSARNEFAEMTRMKFGNSFDWYE